MGLIERADELEDFAVYCRSVKAGIVGIGLPATWEERAEWANACAADFRGAVEALEQMTKDRDRWRHEYRIEKQKNALLRADLRALNHPWGQ